MAEDDDRAALERAGIDLGEVREIEPDLWYWSFGVTYKDTPHQVMKWAATRGAEYTHARLIEHVAAGVRRAETKARATKPAPAPGAEAAIEALGLTDEEELTLAPIPTGWWAKRLRPGGTVREAVGDTLSAALAALRGEAT